MQLSCVDPYQKYNLKVCQKRIDIKNLNLLCNKFYTQSTIAGGYVQSIEVLYNYKFHMHYYFFSFKQNNKILFVLNNSSNC